MKVVSEETKRKISEALKRHYASAGKKVNEVKDFVKDTSPLGAKETIKREAKNLPGRASYEAKKAVGTVKEKVNNTTKKIKDRAKLARDTYNDVKGARDPEEALERARKRLKP